MSGHFLLSLLTGAVIVNGSCICSTRPYNINPIPISCVFGTIVKCHAVIRALRKELLLNEI